MLGFTTFMKYRVIKEKTRKVFTVGKWKTVKVSCSNQCRLMNSVRSNRVDPSVYL